MKAMDRNTHIPTRRHTRRLAVILALALAATPLAAQEAPDRPANPDLAEGAEMLSQGLKKLFRGLMDELEPAGEAAEAGWNDLIDWLGDLSAYEAPERLPNGDIVIRRKEPLDTGTDL